MSALGAILHPLFRVSPLLQGNIFTRECQEAQPKPYERKMRRGKKKKKREMFNATERYALQNEEDLKHLDYEI